MGSNKKIIEVRGKKIGGDEPLICTPIIGENTYQLINELKKVLTKKPDLIEWRADFFQDLNNIPMVIDTASKIREIAGEVPILFTIRSPKEGGQLNQLSEEHKVKVITEVCKSKLIDIIDYEMNNDRMNIQYIRYISKKYGIYLLLSYHNFLKTPSYKKIIEKLHRAELYGADIAKISVMPNAKKDILTLLQATLAAQETIHIPMVTISMSNLGAISRMIGWFFGSDFTFALGDKSSAQGQLPIEELRISIKLLQTVFDNNSEDILQFFNLS